MYPNRNSQMCKSKALLTLALAGSIMIPAAAQQSAHVHGFASINLAIEGDELEIEFVSPADSIVGFEYEPSTAAERKAVKDAIALLQNPEKMFSLPASAGCELHEVEAERHAEGDHDGHGHDEHAKHDDHDDHDHDEHAKHDDHDDHDHDEHAKKDDHDDHDHDEHAKHDDHDHDHDKADADETHSEFHAHYHFDCKNPAIAEIGLRVFKTWPKIEQVRVQALTPGGQTGGNIEAGDPVIRLQ